MAGKSSKRSIDTCNTCRSRKVRCDGIRSVCGNCDRLGLPCSYQHSETPERHTRDFPRQRSQRACRGCRQRKMRCTGDQPSCERCQHLGLDCSYPRLRQSAAAETAFRHLQNAHLVNGSVRDPTPANTSEILVGSPEAATTTLLHHPPLASATPPILPNDATMARVFDNFFIHLYPIPAFSFLHKASLVQRYRAGLRDDILLSAMVGITSLLTDLGPELRQDSSRYIDAAEAGILSGFEQPSIAKVQALVFIIEHRILAERSAAAFTLISIAVRHSYALRLNYENPNLCFLAQESRRRLMWSVFLFDIHLASGLSEFTLCSAELLYIQLPCNETSFELDIEQKIEQLFPIPDQSPSKYCGLMAFCVRLYWIRGRILHTTKRIVVSRTQDVDAITNQVLALGKELRDFAASLPPGYELTEKNLHLRAHTNRMAPHTLLHIWWRQCHCILYRIALAGLHEALPRQVIRRLDPTFVSTCQRECFENANTVINSFRIILSLKAQPPFLDFHLPICAYQCARMLFYSYRTNAAAFGLSLDSVVAQTHLCLEMIKRSPCPRKGLQVVQRDLEKLIERGDSRSPTPDPPTIGSQTGASPHMISRHSLIKGICANRDSDDTLTIPSGPSPASTTFQNQTRTVRAEAEISAASRPSRQSGHQPPDVTSNKVADIQEHDAFDGSFYPEVQVPDLFDLNTWNWPFDLWPGYHDPTADSLGQDGLYDDNWTTQGI